MPAIPQQRPPRCLRHHVWHADCEQCAEQRQTEREAARQRVEKAAR